MFIQCCFDHSVSLINSYFNIDSYYIRRINNKKHIEPGSGYSTSMWRSHYDHKNECETHHSDVMTVKLFCDHHIYID